MGVLDEISNWNFKLQIIANIEFEIDDFIYCSEGAKLKFEMSSALQISNCKFLQIMGAGCLNQMVNFFLLFSRILNKL
jgi:hypothetical protein